MIFYHTFIVLVKEDKKKAETRTTTMKLLMLFLLALWSTCMVASDSSHERRVLVSELEDDEAWPTGTPVLYQYQGDWYEGTITHYFNGVYTITWVKDGEVEYFDDEDTVDKMVAAYQNNQDPTTYNVGTVVYRYFETEKKFHHGEIVSYSNGVYEVKWSNGVVETYPAGGPIDALVQAAEDASALTTAPPGTDAPITTATEAVMREGSETMATQATQATQPTGGTGTGTIPPTAADTPADTDEDTGTIAPTEDSTPDDTVDVTMEGSFEIGTKVYKYFEGDDFYWGTISWYSDGVYTITWEDNSKEKYDNLKEVIEMVERASRQNQGDAKESDPWEKGTAVFKSFAEGDFFGEITDYSNGQYKIKWSDGGIELYSVEQTDLMVKAAYDKVEEAKAAKTAEASAAATSSSKGGLSGGIKFLIVLVVFSVVGLFACYMRRLRTRKTKTKTVNSIHKDGDNLAPGPTYQDEPDAAAPLPDVI